MATQTHIAWDRGILTGDDFRAKIAIATGTWLTQKTCKSYCGTRVKMDRIDNDNPSCLDCRTRIVEYARGLREGFLSFNILDLTDKEREEIADAIHHCEQTIKRYL